MAVIRPFKALRFSPQAGPMEELVCPPYDIISEQQRRAYLAHNPHNIIRLELPRDGQDPYDEAGRVLRAWREAGALRQDEQAAFYVYDITFDVPGRAGLRVTGLIAQVKLEPFDKGVILPHEETLSKAKADRFELMKATACNFSDIYSLYPSEGGQTLDLDALTAGLAPVTDVTDAEGLRHRLWAVTAPQDVAAIQNKLADTKLYIADGHHRYETALNYQRWRQEQGLATGGEDYVMMMLVDMNHPGLVVFPTHRLVRDLPTFDAEALLAASEEYFDVQRGLPAAAIAGALDAAYAAGKHAFGLYADGRAAVLTLRDDTMMDDLLPGASTALRRLDVSILHTLVLERLLGIDKANMANQINLTYTRDSQEALTSVDSGAAQAAFLLNPTRVSEIRDVAAAGEKMPQKSTYFYPKLITGLTMNSLD